MTTANRFSALFKAPTKLASTDEKCSYTNDFPSLDEAKKIPVKAELDLTAKVESDLNKKEALPTESRKQTQTKMILGHRSYEEELRTEEVSYDTKRVEAYELLANKEKLETALAKTRMCNSIDKKEECKHGDQCRFAHNLEELKISNCLFEDNCRFIKMYDGKLRNNGAKICNHKHPQESREDFMSRVGLDKYNKQKSKQNLLPRPQQQFIPPPPPTQPPTQPQFVPQPPTQPQQNVATSTEQTLIIRVPKELASQALEIAMKNGRMNIQIEII